MKESERERNLVHPHMQKPLSVIYELTMSRLRYHRRELYMEVHVMLECEFAVLSKEDLRIEELR